MLEGDRQYVGRQMGRVTSNSDEFHKENKRQYAYVELSEWAAGVETSRVWSGRPL